MINRRELFSCFRRVKLKSIPKLRAMDSALKPPPLVAGNRPNKVEFNCADALIFEERRHEGEEEREPFRPSARPDKEESTGLTLFCRARLEMLKVGLRRNPRDPLR